MIFFTFLLLNQEHGEIMNARSRFSQSAIPNGHLQKKRSTREKKKKRKKEEVFRAHSAIWQSSIVQVHARRSDTVTDQRFSTAASILKSWTYICQYIDQVRV